MFVEHFLYTQSLAHGTSDAASELAGLPKCTLLMASA